MEVSVPPYIQIGKNCRIHESVHMGEEGFYYKDFVQVAGDKGIIIGENVDIRGGCTVHRGIHRDTFIDDNVKINANAHIAHDTVLGKNVIIGAGVMFGGEITVGENSEIWMNASLHQGITIGRNSTVGANTYLRHDLEDNMVAYGDIIKRRDECKKYNPSLRK